MSLTEAIVHLTTDKNTTHAYIPLYEKLLSSKKTTANNVLEIGIGDTNTQNGGSIQLWRKYFTNAKIHALDILPISRVLDELVHDDRVILYTSIDAYNADFVKSTFIDKNVQFDVLLDDGPHTLASMITFITLYSQIMTSDGILIIEDIPNITWIDKLKKSVPDHLKQFIRVYDLRKKKKNDLTILCLPSTDINYY